ncbi:hypothetical protein [Amycolatopsis ultiminotia]|uniref:hypothetical protein n=1 Tax=Amycolatopsis ultiminotia TaxID=543629 RepID=UPI0031E791F6
MLAHEESFPDGEAPGAQEGDRPNGERPEESRRDQCRRKRTKIVMGDTVPAGRRTGQPFSRRPGSGQRRRTGFPGVTGVYLVALWRRSGAVGLSAAGRAPPISNVTNPSNTGRCRQAAVYAFEPAGGGRSEPILMDDRIPADPAITRTHFLSGVGQHTWNGLDDNNQAAEVIITFLGGGPAPLPVRPGKIHRGPLRDAHYFSQPWTLWYKLHTSHTWGLA